MRTHLSTPILSRLLAGISLIFLLTACAPVQATPDPALLEPTELVTYVHPTGVFALDLPATWVVNDTSDSYALNVEFSPPGYGEALLSVYVVTVDALGGVAEIETVGGEISPELFAEHFIETFYVGRGFVYKEEERGTQADGSVRLRFLIESQGVSRQHNDFLQLNGAYFVAMRVLLPPDDTGQHRILGRVVNTLQVNPAAGWNSAVAEAADENTNPDAIGFASLNAWADRNGGFNIVGQIQNRTAGPLEFVRITAQLYDAENRLLDERDDFISSDLVTSGEYVPFSIIFTDGFPAGAVRYDLSASARYADFAARTFYGPQNFEITSDASFDDTGLLVINGQVRNEGPLRAELVKVIITIFDENGRVIGTDTTLVDNQALAPGDVSGYSVSFVELGGNPARFIVTAQGVITE